MEPPQISPPTAPSIESNSKPPTGSYKSTYGILAATLALCLNLSSWFQPLRASLGGDWRPFIRTHRHTDYNSYYAGSSLFPHDMFVYVPAVIVLILLGVHFARARQAREVLVIYLALSALPFVWAAVTFKAGFAPHRCLSYLPCHDPTRIIVVMLALHTVIVIASLAIASWLIRSYRRFKNNSPSGTTLQP
jgi:hypothetical protein